MLGHQLLTDLESFSDSTDIELQNLILVEHVGSDCFRFLSPELLLVLEGLLFLESALFHLLELPFHLLLLNSNFILLLSDT